MIMDIDAVHSALQFPMVTVLFALAVLMGMQSRRAALDLMTSPSVATMAALAVFFVAWGIRQGYWHMYWALRANDKPVWADQMLSAPVVPIAMNIIALCAAGAAIAVAARPYLKKWSAGCVAAGLFALIALGAALAGVRP